MASTPFDTHSPSNHALADVVATDSLTHECPDGCTVHIVDDNHLQGATAELTVVSTRVGFQEVKVDVFRVFDSVKSCCVLSSCSTNAP